MPSPRKLGVLQTGCGPVCFKAVPQPPALPSITPWEMKADWCEFKASNLSAATLVTREVISK